MESLSQPTLATPSQEPAQRKVHQDPSAPSGRTERLIALSGRILHTLGIARALVEGRRNLDLTGIDDGIGTLCAQTLDLAPEEARVMLPHLDAVLAQADLLSQALRHRAF